MSSNNRLELVRRNSRAQVVLGVQRHGPISRVQLAKLTGQSLTGIGRVVDELISEGMLVETGTAASPRGRPMVLLSINPDGEPSAGVWLGPEFIQIAITDPNGEILGRRAISYDSGDGKPLTVMIAITQGIQRCAEAAGKNAKRLRGVGVSVAGQVDLEHGIIHSITNRPSWKNVHITQILQARLGVPVYASDDIRAGALASEWFNGQNNSAGALYVVINNGINAAFINNNEVLHGAHDSAALIGHTTIDHNGRLCECGNRGCLETVASDIAFVRQLWPSYYENTRQKFSPEELAGESPDANTTSTDGEGFYLHDMQPSAGVSVGGGVLPADLDISVDMSMGGGDIWCAGVAYRQSETGTCNSNGYYAYFTPNGKSAVISYCTPTGTSDIARIEIDPPIVFSVMHTLRVRAVGNHHQVWLDGEKYIDATDDTMIGSGHVNLIEVNGDNYFGNWAYFDNLQIELIGTPGSTLTGKIVDSDSGKAIMGAKVQLSTGQSSVTLADGTYLFANLGAGKYGITVIDDAHYGSTGYVNIENDSSATYDFKLNPTPSSALSDVTRKTQDERDHQEIVEMVHRGIEMAKKGDLKARDALTTVAKYLGIGIANAITLFDPNTVYICGEMIDADPNLMIDLIRREVLEHIPNRCRGVEIRTFTNINNFLMQGSIGLALSRPYQALQEENKKTRSIVYVKPITWRADE